MNMKAAVCSNHIKSKSSMRVKPNKSLLKKLYLKESRSIRNIAELLGCSKDKVYRALKEYKIESRRHVEKRSQLQEFNLSFLKEEIKLKGFNHVARDLGVHNTTLRRYIEKMKTQR